MRKAYIIGVLFGAVLLVLGACVPTAPPPVRPKPLPPPSEKATHKIIEDLAYIKVLSSEYSDDADPEKEGAEIRLLWYDSKSELIHFRNVPMRVSIEILTYEYDRKTHKYEPIKSVYKSQAQIDSSSSHIRIPFEHIKADPRLDKIVGMLQIVIHTPEQGDFSPVNTERVPLYERPEPPPPPDPVPLPESLPSPSA